MEIHIDSIFMTKLDFSGVGFHIFFCSDEILLSSFSFTVFLKIHLCFSLQHWTAVLVCSVAIKSFGDFDHFACSLQFLVFHI